MNNIITTSSIRISVFIGKYKNALLSYNLVEQNIIQNLKSFQNHNLVNYFLNRIFNIF